MNQLGNGADVDMFMVEPDNSMVLRTTSEIRTVLVTHADRDVYEQLKSIETNNESAVSNALDI